MRVLILEDDTDIGEAIARYLGRAGYSVDRAVSLASAEEKMSVNSYDALVLDRMVPDGDSLELLAGYRRRGGKTPALFLTARDSIDDRAEGLGAGADDYLINPFAMDELVARVHVLSRRAVASTSPVLTIEDVELDPNRMTATRSGNDLPLTVKEFAVLRYLLTRVGEVVTRTDLIEHCWDEFAEPMSNVVDVKVAQLRKKLGEPALLHTVRGAGYVLEVR